MPKTYTTGLYIYEKKIEIKMLIGKENLRKEIRN